MKTFSINTLGCKVNQYESQQIRELLEHLGLAQLEYEQKEKADLFIVNTCCVTHTASAKSRQAIRKAQRLNPDATIIIAGCLPAVQLDELTEPKENVLLIRDRQALATKLNRLIKDKTFASNLQNSQYPSDKPIRTKNSQNCKHKNNPAQTNGLAEIKAFKGHTRAFLKIQDGCDGSCSYCIIPKARPKISSKPAEVVLSEAEALVEAGHKEIVLTGIFLGAYGQPTTRRRKWTNGENRHLAELLSKMAKIPALWRIRLSSLEPADLTERLLDVFCENHNIMPHLHLSLQSGSDAVLKRMCRQYRVAEFREKIALLRQRLDRPAVTTDLIVGFPGESEKDFEQTAELAKEIGFSRIHVFSYSARAGTAAAKMQNKVDSGVIKNRACRLNALDRQLQSQFRRQFIGDSAVILTENSNGQVVGKAERYFKVYVKNTSYMTENGALLKVKLTGNTEDGLVGE